MESILTCAETGRLRRAIAISTAFLLFFIEFTFLICNFNQVTFIQEITSGGITSLGSERDNPSISRSVGMGTDTTLRRNHSTMHGLP
ncbi:Uncharacterised protein [Segatella copri]|nr:Uncharacterised protein [Segatella copri]